MKLIALALAALSLAACGAKEEHPAVVSEKVQVVQQAVPAACPSKDEYARLLSLRPTPLRETIKPADRVEKASKVAGQLGKYEADGGVVDQAFEALKSCSSRPELIIP